MKRSSFVKSIASAVLALGIAAGGAQAQDKKVRVQMGGAFTSSTAILGSGQLRFAEIAKKLSGGSIDIKFFEPGALVPAGQYFDAIASGSLDMAFTSVGFFTGREIAFALFSSVPFGPELGEYVGWMRHGGGEKMMQDITLNKFGFHSFICGVIPPEASGWFRKEIKTLDDLKGLKMRFFGLGANVMQKLGVSTQLIQPGEIFQALQLGTIDATEFSMPIMDLTLGLHQVAKHYYFPGWHQMSSYQHLFISKAKWGEFSDTQKEIIKASCDTNMFQMMAEAEIVQVQAIKDIQAKGVTLHYWDKPILDAMRKAWFEVVKEQSDKSPDFKKAWESLSAFREQYKIWKGYGYLKE